MDDDLIVTAFNNWMKAALTDWEEAGEREKKAVERFKIDLAAGRTPRYGRESLALLKAYSV